MRAIYEMMLRRWNQFDFVVVVLSVVGLVIDQFNEDHLLPINPTIIRVMRLLRIARSKFSARLSNVNKVIFHFSSTIIEDGQRNSSSSGHDSAGVTSSGQSVSSVLVNLLHLRDTRCGTIRSNFVQ